MLIAGWSAWIGGALLVPVVVCGGLTLFAPETLFPLLAVPMAYPAALTGVVGGLLADGHRRLHTAGGVLCAVVLGAAGAGVLLDWLSRLV